MPAFRRPSLFWPLLLIGVGALLLAQSFGLVPAGIWAALAQLWPVLLILVGIDLLVGRRPQVGPALVAGAGVLLVAGALILASLRASQLPPGALQSLALVDGGATRLSARIDFHGGELRLSALGPSDHLMEGIARNGPGESVRQDFALVASEGRLVLEQQTMPLLDPFLTLRGSSALWELHLSQRLPLALDVSTGAGAVRLDLSGLPLTSLMLTTGPGETIVTFPGQPAQASLRTGPGATTLNLPLGIPVRLSLRTGASNVLLPAGLARSGDDYTSPGFDPARPFFGLQLSAGLGRVVIK